MTKAKSDEAQSVEDTKEEMSDTLGVDDQPSGSTSTGSITAAEDATATSTTEDATDASTSTAAAVEALTSTPAADSTGTSTSTAATDATTSTKVTATATATASISKVCKKSAAKNSTQGLEQAQRALLLLDSSKVCNKSAAKCIKSSAQALEYDQRELLLLENNDENDIICSTIMPLSGSIVGVGVLDDVETLASAASLPGAFPVSGIGIQSLESENASLHQIQQQQQEETSARTTAMYLSSFFSMSNRNPTAGGHGDSNNHGLVEARPVDDNGNGSAMQHDIEHAQQQGLTRARPIRDPSKLAMYSDASSTNSLSWGERPKRMQVLLLLLILSIVIGSVIVAVKISSRESQQEMEPTSTPTQYNGDPLANSDAARLLLNILPNASIQRIREQHKLGTYDQDLQELIVDPSSTPTNMNIRPQLDAFEWFIQDPFLISNATVVPYYTTYRMQQRFALATLFFATNGSQWYQNEHWLSYDVHECQWFHSASRFSFLEFTVIQSPCSAAAAKGNTDGNATATTEDDSYYETLSLVNNNLHGSLPEEMYLLSHLRAINIYENRQIEGPLSTQVGLLSKLEYLNLMRSTLRETIPSEIGRLGNLRSLFLGNNSLVGSLPTEIGNLTSLQEITVNGNRIGGVLPTEIGLLQSLMVAGFQETSIGGSIPSEIGQLRSNFRYGYFHQTRLSSSLPTELGTMDSLAWLHVYSNAMTGTIPTELGLLTNMQELVLSNNALSGSIPTEVGRMTNLYLLFLSQNHLSGAIPTSALTNLTNIKFLDLSDNSELSGTIPTSLLDLNVTFLSCNGSMSHCDAINGGRSY